MFERDEKEAERRAHAPGAHTDHPDLPWIRTRAEGSSWVTAQPANKTRAILIAARFLPLNPKKSSRA